MARSSRPRVIDSSDEDDNEFPDLADLARQKRSTKSRGILPSQSSATNGSKTASEGASNAPASVRRRKLGLASDNALLRAWTPDGGANDGGNGSDDAVSKKARQPRRPRVRLRARKSKPVAVTPPAAVEEQDDYVSAQEEVTITEEVSLVSDAAESGESDPASDDEDDDFIDDEFHEDDEDDGQEEFFPSRSPPRTTSRLKIKKTLQTGGRPTSIGKQTVETTSSANHKPPRKVSSSRDQRQGSKTVEETSERDLTNTFSRLQL